MYTDIKSNFSEDTKEIKMRQHKSIIANQLPAEAGFIGNLKITKSLRKNINEINDDTRCKKGKDVLLYR